MDYYTNQNYYDILGVEKGASQENIYRAMIRLKYGNPNDRVSISLFPKIDEAYNVLSNRQKREEYDKKLNDGYFERRGETGHEDDEKDEVESTSVEDQIQPEPPTPQEEQTQPETPTPQEEQTQLETPTSEIKYTSDFNPEKKENKKQKSNPSKFGKLLKSTLVPIGGAIAGFAITGMVSIGGVAAPLGAIVGFATASFINKFCLKKGKKLRLIKDIKEKKIKKVNTEEAVLIEEYNKKLDDEINKLLSEPYNNYKLEIAKRKYTNQVELLEELLKVKFNKKVKKEQEIIHKFDIIATKNQLETAKRNLEKVTEKIQKYESGQVLAELNQELIEKNKQIREMEQTKSSSIQNLKIEQNILLKKRNQEASRIKTRVIRSGKVYDGFVKAKDFVRSIPMVLKSDEEIDSFVNTETEEKGISRK